VSLRCFPGVPSSFIAFDGEKQNGEVKRILHRPLKCPRWTPVSMLSPSGNQRKQSAHAQVFSLHLASAFACKLYCTTCHHHPLRNHASLRSATPIRAFPPAVFNSPQSFPLSDTGMNTLGSPRTSVILNLPRQSTLKVSHVRTSTTVVKALYPL
jgi:hypothetical protein